MLKKLWGLFLAALALAACSDGDGPSADDLPSVSVQPSAWSSLGADDPPLNLLLLSLDTTRADHLSCYGFGEQTTPNLDRLARAGVLFEEAFTSVPITLPAHATMQTGLYPFQHGVRTNGLYVVGENQVTLAELLLAKGYDTGAVLGAFPVDSRFGLAQGFSHYNDDFAAAAGRSGAQMAERSGSEVTRLALQWIDRPREQPFYLWCHYFDPHAPYDPPEPHRSRFRDCSYCGEIAAMDSAIGGLLDGLESRGLLGRTIVVVAGDHGESLGEHDEQTHAFYIYDSTLRVPMIWRFPPTGQFSDSLWRGRRLSGLVNLTDLLPTAWNALGLGRNELPDLAGMSLLPLIQGEGGGHDWLYHESLIPQLDFGAGDLRGLRMWPWKYIRAPRPELFDLRQDPGERINLAEKHSDLVRSLEERLQTVLGDEAGPSVVKSPDPETVAKLRSLGYVAGGQPSAGSKGPLFDPKDLGGYAEAAEQAFVISRENRPQQALVLVDSLLAVFAEPVFVHQLRGRLLLELDRPEEAVVASDEALARCGDCPHRSDLLLQRAMATLAGGRPDDALAQTEALLEQGVKKLGLRLFLSTIWEVKGDREKARQALRQEADLWPGHPQPLLRLGELETRVGHLEEAEGAYRELLSAKPHHLEAMNALSELLANSGREREASSLVVEVLAIDPFHPGANLRRGLELQQRGRPEDAVGCFETAMKYDPDDPLAPTLLGTALASLGRQEEARAALKAAVATGRALPEAYANLGLVYAKQDRQEEAVATWQEGINRDPEGPYANQMRTFIEQSRHRLD